MRVRFGKSPITLAERWTSTEGSVGVTSGNRKNSWHNTAMLLLILASLAMVGTIAYIITLQDLTYYAISYITGLLITVTGILLGLSGITPLSKSLERMKLQATLTITTLLWLVAIIMIAQTYGFSLTVSTPFLRYLFLTGVGLFTILVVFYSTSTIEATRQRLMAAEAAKASQSGKTTG
jgi:peptidoglycan/LPS O-acetylase OafA/YrhL